ncbi:TPM domain-containing protein [Enterococcus rivorum]|uniref:TPM domain-containing protein n=1 Tax=Enterococcus rivorum TaxID=762845 RepID=A0A1E5KY77_9ENTE|nr:TPM domain-containing protein [Enterococcus rivorum]MBP2099767.1 uncharacterized protein [Enterococcus rivorum]OEH82649.1 hypothetical protein BCR26_12520 [Enterococcus rivorum]
MKKFTFSILLLFSLLFCFAVNVQAASDSVEDYAGLFKPEEISQFKELIAPIEKKSKARVFILTTYQNNQTAQKFADLFMLGKIGKDANGVTFLIDMDNREFYISTSGNMIDYMDDSRIDQALDIIEPNIKNGDYFQAGTVFLKSVQKNFDAGVPGGHYRVDTETGKIIRYKVLTGREIDIALFMAGIITIIVVIGTVSSYNLKSVIHKYPFREKSSLNLITKTDHLSNSFVTTRRITKSSSNSSHQSSSNSSSKNRSKSSVKRKGGGSTHKTNGGTFGGGGRKF